VYAVDISMPIGTDIYAARGGTVVEVASSNYRGGLDTSRPGAEANLVRILHDDGTFAIYAHLNWNSIRVRPGDEVVRGEYIADSGNTGFSSGPHLHFVVVRNAGMSMEAVPIVFEGRNSSSIAPQRGLELTAY
jgi:murein DD-endopeptidase MepM/ murein hydrolase activator NlpD